MDNCVAGLRNAQTRWAETAAVPRLGAFGNTPRLDYTRQYEDNLFEPLSSVTEQWFEKADGQELTDGRKRPAKMSALHSSSALACNFFHYWYSHGQLEPLLDACGLPSGSVATFALEVKLPIDARFRYAPNLDACVTYGADAPIALAAVECKFCEPFAGKKKLLSDKYLADDLADLWADRPTLRSLALSCTSRDTIEYRHLDVPQLLKHLLGLRKQGAGRATQLLYLYFDPAGPEGIAHRDELRRFTAIAEADGVAFSTLSYQLIMTRLEADRTAHASWFDYMTARYFSSGSGL